MVTQGDSGSRVSGPAEPDLWALPRVVSLEVVRALYRNPRRHFVRGALVEMAEGLEITIRTDGEIPVRALSPALFVGGVEVRENETLSPTAYRFFVLDDQAPPPGAPVALGWAGLPGTAEVTEFRYQPPIAARQEQGREAPPDGKKRGWGLWRLLLWIVRRLRDLVRPG